MRQKFHLSALIGIITAVACVSTVFAADLAPLHPAEVASTFSWSGFYIGVFGGYGRMSDDWTLINTTPPPNFPFLGTPEGLRSTGALGGIEIGADHQIGNWVVGIGADLSLIDSDSSGTTLLPQTLTSETVRSQVNWLATLTGRVGYAFDRSLFYAKGGLAGAEFKDEFFLSDVAGGFYPFNDETTARVGWTVGAGYEYAVFDNWTVKLEYDYLGFGGKDETFAGNLAGAGAGFDQSIKRSLQLVKAGIDYKL